MSKDTERKERRKKILMQEDGLRREQGLWERSWNCAEGSRKFQRITLRKKK